MKRLLISVAVVALVSTLAQAQSTVNPKAKVDPKNNKVSRPVVDKPKPILMSRNQIRECQEIEERIQAEDQVLPPVVKAWEAEHAELLAALAESNKTADGLNKAGADLKNDAEALGKLQEALNAEIKGGKLKKDEQIKKIKDFEESRAAVQKRIDDFNTQREAYGQNKAKLDQRIKPHDAAKIPLNERIEALADDRVDFKSKCADRTYEEADWNAVKAERTRAKAAADAASAAAAAASAAK
ncbi:hypothetical protein [Roseateles microcysteis]|uniref:hypothetical protein n=1 Tax=Roseateles microcysteis TaxID=3119057 RepID=UPI002FE60DAA